ncbi:aminotransferase class III-fold pyridoxal phosphate-dependent enzyme [Rhodococcus sp. IEGM1428]|uniref:aminotransferase class III-fold pyridoxal phosphate-dependent enzyme n=1 Tax=Rhodococcus sp. IEGM1428 TaxID=3392191 RepID=UPI003D0E4400
MSIDLVDTGVVHAGTYNGNPIGLAAVGATLDVLGAPTVYDELDDTSARLEVAMRSALAELPTNPTIRRIGSLIVVAEDELPEADRLWPQITERLLYKNVVALPSGKIFVSTEHTDKDTELMQHALTESVDHLSARV